MMPIAPVLAAILMAHGSADSQAAPPAAPKPPAVPAPPAEPKVPDSPAAPAVPTERGPVHSIVLKDLDGQDLPLDRYAGTPMVIEVWSTTCGPCVKQRELMSRLAPEYRGKVAFIGASVDGGGSRVVRGHLAKHPVSPDLVEAMATPPLIALIATRERLPTIPKIVYVDSRGRMVDIGTSVQSEAWMRAMLKNLK